MPWPMCFHSSMHVKRHELPQLILYLLQGLHQPPALRSLFLGKVMLSPWMSINTQNQSHSPHRFLMLVNILFL